jgi:copper(I)-binding protein
MRLQKFWLMLVIISQVLFACNEDASKLQETEKKLINEKYGKIKIKDPWFRPAAKGMNSALYFEIVNNPSEPDTLYKAESSLAQKVEVHETFMVDDKMGMRKVESLVINPNSKVSLKPGGYHVMLIRLLKDLKKGDKGEVKLFFKTAGQITIEAVVKTMKNKAVIKKMME